MTTDKKITFCKVPSHVGIHGNEKADAEARVASEIPNVYTQHIPYTDFKHNIKELTKKKYQESWNDATEKLRKIKPNTDRWPTFPNRWEDTTITRLRVGHTNITHAYLMSRGRPPDPPMCCNTRLTVKHLLLDCDKYIQYRLKYKLPGDIEDLLGPECPKDDLIGYLRETELMTGI